MKTLLLTSFQTRFSKSFNHPPRWWQAVTPEKHAVVPYRGCLCIILLPFRHMGRRQATAVCVVLARLPPSSRPPIALQIHSNWRCWESTGSLLLIVTFPPLTVRAAERSAKRALCKQPLSTVRPQRAPAVALKAPCGAPRYILVTTFDGASFHLASHKNDRLDFYLARRDFFFISCRSTSRVCDLVGLTLPVPQGILLPAETGDESLSLAALFRRTSNMTRVPCSIISLF